MGFSEWRLWYTTVSVQVWRHCVYTTSMSPIHMWYTTICMLQVWHRHICDTPPCVCYKYDTDTSVIYHCVYTITMTHMRYTAVCILHVWHRPICDAPLFVYYKYDTDTYMIYHNVYTTSMTPTHLWLHHCVYTTSMTPTYLQYTTVCILQVWHQYIYDTPPCVYYKYDTDLSAIHHCVYATSMTPIHMWYTTVCILHVWQRAICRDTPHFGV